MTRHLYPWPNVTHSPEPSRADIARLTAAATARHASRTVGDRVPDRRTGGRAA